MRMELLDKHRLVLREKWPHFKVFFREVKMRRVTTFSGAVKTLALVIQFYRQKLSTISPQIKRQGKISTRLQLHVSKLIIALASKALRWRQVQLTVILLRLWTAHYRMSLKQDKTH